MAKNLISGPILAQIRFAKFFFSKIWLRQSPDITVNYHHVQFQKKLMIQSWETLVRNGQTDGQTDKSDFIGRWLTRVRASNKCFGSSLTSDLGSHYLERQELIQRSHCCSIRRCFHFDKSLQDAVAAAQIEVNIVYDWTQKWNLIWMLTRAKFIHYPEKTTAKGALLLPSEESKLELTTPVGYLVFFFKTNIRQIKQ